MRPQIEGLEHGQLLVRLNSEQIDPRSRERFYSTDIPSKVQEQFATIIVRYVRYIRFRLSDKEDFIGPIAVETNVSLKFDGFRNCRLLVSLTPEHIEKLRQVGSLCVEIPERMDARLNMVKSLDLEFADEVPFPLTHEEAPAPFTLAKVPA